MNLKKSLTNFNFAIFTPHRTLSNKMTIASKF